jgi:lipoprotein-anchoring transpeptidase ErfK/SrfK
VIAADDPTNPLGERWIPLEGIEGEAVGQQSYGIHGTIEADSIGRNRSMGCIRLTNADVEVLYDLLVESKSMVRIVP